MPHPSELRIGRIGGQPGVHALLEHADGGLYAACLGVPDRQGLLAWNHASAEPAHLINCGRCLVALADIRVDVRASMLDYAADIVETVKATLNTRRDDCRTCGLPVARSFRDHTSAAILAGTLSRLRTVAGRFRPDGEEQARDGEPEASDG